MQTEMKCAVKGASLVHSEEADAAFEAIMLDEKVLTDNLEPISIATLDLNCIEKWSTCSSEKDLSITKICRLLIYPLLQCAFDSMVISFCSLVMLPERIWQRH